MESVGLVMAAGLREPGLGRTPTTWVRRVPKENIDVSTLAMMDLQRHRRATAERPMIDDCSTELTYSIVARAIRNSRVQSDCTFTLRVGRRVDAEPRQRQ
jgi:hypothetical protein